MSLAPDPAVVGIYVTPLWRLGARPQRVAAAAQTWRELAAEVEDVGRQVGSAGATLLTTWQGTSASAYHDHRTQTLAYLTNVSTVAHQAAGALATAAQLLDTAQEQLDEAWQRLARHAIPVTVCATGSGAGLIIVPVDAAQERIVRAAIDEALDIRAWADTRLATLAHDLTGRLGELPPWPAVDQEWAAWAPAAEPTTPSESIVDGNRVIVTATGGDDDIAVSFDARTGERLITIGGLTRRVPAEADLVVRAGGGNDTITVAPGCPVRVTLLGGGGDDVIRGGGGDDTLLGLWGYDTLLGGPGHDRVSGGPGWDYVDGQEGDDTLDGGAGSDTLYGLAGRDLLWGGTEADYLDAGPGDDLVVGGEGPDILVGGRGADTLTGDAWAEGGPTGGRSEQADRVLVQAGDTVSGVGRPVTVELTDIGGFIRVEGSPEFVARVESDLDALRSTRSGATMLAALQQSHEDTRAIAAGWPVVGGLVSHGDTLVIRETADANGYAHSSWDLRGTVHATVDYNPTFDDLTFGPPVPPVVVLFHELAHVYDAYYDATALGVYDGPDNPGAPNSEREAVGLPIDDDANPTTAYRLVPSHPYPLTENGLREELGLRLRQRY